MNEGFTNANNRIDKLESKIAELNAAINNFRAYMKQDYELEGKDQKPKPKFKVGDKVRIIYKGSGCAMNPDRYGMEGIVDEVLENDIYKITYGIYTANYEGKHLELIEPEKPKEYKIKSVKDLKEWIDKKSLNGWKYPVTDILQAIQELEEYGKSIYANQLLGRLSDNYKSGVRHIIEG